MKIMLALAIVLVVAACAPGATPGWTYSPITTDSASPATSTDASSGPDGFPSASPAPSASLDSGLQTISMTVKDFRLDPRALDVVGPIALAVTNQGPTLHNITIRAQDGTVLVGTKDLREGESEVISFDLAPGTYTTFCSLPGHESLGIVGSLTVSP